MAEARRFHPLEATDEELRAVYEISSTIDLEMMPDESPEPYEQLVARLTARIPTQVETRRWVAEQDGRIVGYGASQRWPEDDPANSFLWVGVLAPYRRNGVGRLMLEGMLAELQEAGSTKIIIDVPDGAPWEPFFPSLGLEHVFTERVSRLKIEDLDWDLMDSWIEQSADRASDYELLFLEIPIDEEYLERWCQINNVMNTAPREDLDIEDFSMTPEKWRQREQNQADRGDRFVAYVAVHKPTGDFAGYTDVALPQHEKSLVHQHDTGVDPAHRDKGLGRWLKAAMVKWLIAERPELERILTGNAGSNEAMLAINDEMGFKPVLWQKAWQGDIAEARQRLAAH